MISKFLPRDNELSIAIGGIAVKWWYTKKALKLFDNIANMSGKYDKKLAQASIEDLSSNIRDTLEGNANNEKLFSIFSKEGNTLFERRFEKRVQTFSITLWNVLYTSMKKSLGSWLILYPLPGISSETYNIKFDGIYIIKSNDKSYWESFNTNYPSLRYWNPITCKNENKSKTFSIDPPNTWLVCKSGGTENRSRFNASLTMRKFIAILFAFLSESFLHATSKSMRKTNSYCVQFPSIDSDTLSSQIFTNIGNLLHPILGEIELTSVILNKVYNWYNACTELRQESFHRITKAAHFFNYALIMSDVERFIYYFIVLDALFGERNKVEKSIKNGIKSHCTTSNWQDKIEYIFELRSDLIHGGSSYIEECKVYNKYLNHFGIDPKLEVETLATKCLREFPYKHK